MNNQPSSRAGPDQGCRDEWKCTTCGGDRRQPDNSERVGANRPHTQSGPMRVQVARRTAIGSRATSALSTI